MAQLRRVNRHVTRIRACLDGRPTHTVSIAQSVSAERATWVSRVARPASAGYVTVISVPGGHGLCAELLAASPL